MKMSNKNGHNGGGTKILKKEGGIYLEFEMCQSEKQRKKLHLKKFLGENRRRVDINNRRCCDANSLDSKSFYWIFFGAKLKNFIEFMAEFCQPFFPYILTFNKIKTKEIDNNLFIVGFLGNFLGFSNFMVILTHAKRCLSLDWEFLAESRRFTEISFNLESLRI